MRIRRILVEGLFGFFRHDIPLNDDKPITIIYGPNGFGKTIILRMLDGLLNGRFEIFRRIPFDAFIVTFDDGNQLRVNSLRDENHALEISSTTESDKKFRIPSKSNYPDTKTYNSTRDYLATLGNVLEDLQLLFGTPPRIRSPQIQVSSTTTGDAPDWLNAICSRLHVKLIATQRLEVSNKESSSYSLGRRPTVASHSEELKGKIKEVLAQHGALSEKLDRSFPTRLLEQSGPISEADELQDKLARLEEKRARLAGLGFLDSEKSITLPTFQAVDKKRDSVAVYVADAEKKLAVFDEMAAKIELLIGIINDLFLYKRMHIDREKGYVFTSHIGQEIQPDDLSSGEPHQLVLLYELLFQTMPGSLVLIDEPEISLHVAWQERFLDDLMKVAKLSKFDVLVATHSAEIIGEYWDLAVGLRGPDQDTDETMQEQVS